MDGSYCCLHERLTVQRSIGPLLTRTPLRRTAHTFI
jgi:hypothetical protein